MARPCAGENQLKSCAVVARGSWPWWSTRDRGGEGDVVLEAAALFCSTGLQAPVVVGRCHDSGLLRLGPYELHCALDYVVLAAREVNGCLRKAMLALSGTGGAHHHTKACNCVIPCHVG